MLYKFDSDLVYKTSFEGVSFKLLLDILDKITTAAEKEETSIIYKIAVNRENNYYKRLIEDDIAANLNKMGYQVKRTYNFNELFSIVDVKVSSVDVKQYYGTNFGIVELEISWGEKAEKPLRRRGDMSV
jgi:hypothetical protein